MANIMKKKKIIGHKHPFPFEEAYIPDPTSSNHSNGIGLVKIGNTDQNTIND
jgi:hypothetical protein